MPKEQKLKEQLNVKELYDQYSKLVFNLALQYVQNQQDAEEIVQDVFVSIHQNQDQFEGKSSAKTWIYRITINKSLDFLRSKKRKKRFGFLISWIDVSAKEEPHQFSHPGIELEQKEGMERLFTWINELPENQKTALILSKIESKSQVEIAEIMNLTPKAVESLVQRAKSNLQKKIDQNEG